MDPSGAEGTWSQGAAEVSEDLGEVQVLEARGGDTGSTPQDLEAPGNSKQLDGGTDRRAEWLKGSSGGGARELAGFSKGGGRGRLGWSISTEGDFVLVDKGDSGLDRTSRNTRDLELRRTSCEGRFLGN